MDLKSHIESAAKSLAITIQTVTQKYKGGVMAIAEEMQAKSGRSLCNKVNPDTESATLNIKELIGIMAVLDDEQRHHILLAFSQLFDHVTIPIGKLNNISSEELLDSWAAWDAERGETAQKIREALQENNKRTLKRISPNEFRGIKKEMMEDIQKELELLRRLEAI